ncbi:uncharacterized protein IUM83_02441 [Phytophthora cinnamomi]|uniref:uncharacterized protein n=1 Tax=Phytophthora cinnamomi TaxID=4785 RepID=UPI00355A0953|nr:hypothetical protein IUM83_02441 [Phytophthora cinnamomi]
MHFDGYKYGVNTTRGNTTYYQCSIYRSTGCKGMLNVKVLDGGDTEVKETGEHTCKSKPGPTVQDCGEEMRQLLEMEVVNSPTVIPSRLWEKVCRQLVAKYPNHAMKPMMREEAINFINYVRKQATGGDVYRQIEAYPTVCVSESDERSFVHFTVFYDNTGDRQRIVGMGHPDLIRLLMYPGASMFIDGTFSITPQPFKQTLIVMVHDHSYNVYIPVMYMLVEAKDEWTYWCALHWVRVLGKMQMTPGSITSDFEAALIKGLRDQCPGTSLIGCLFHWKQAIRRKLVDLRLPTNQIDEAMAPGVLDVLTVIPIDEIRCKGIPYVMSIVNTKGTARIWAGFWDYFVRTWMTMFPPRYGTSTRRGARKLRLLLASALVRLRALAAAGPPATSAWRLFSAFLFDLRAHRVGKVLLTASCRKRMASRLTSILLKRRRTDTGVRRAEEGVLVPPRTENTYILDALIRSGVEFGSMTPSTTSRLVPVALALLPFLFLGLTFKMLRGMFGTYVTIFSWNLAS